MAALHGGVNVRDCLLVGVLEVFVVVVEFFQFYVSIVYYYTLVERGFLYVASLVLG